jgi:6,7-dimethyl-8-ribityllumazine synthase
VRHRDSQEPAAELPSAAGYRFAVIASRFNEIITGSLRDAARAALEQAGADLVDEMRVPGAYELPQAARAVAETGRYDAVVCVGCVIRGETPHFDYISSAVAHGIMEAAGETGVPIAFGVLTTDTEAQALARAGAGPDNKGREAAAAAIDMAVLFRRLGRQPARGGSARPFGFEPAAARSQDS